MNKKIRNFGLVGLASAFLCTAMVGAALLPNVANADDTVVMSSLIGAKTNNVTVTAAQSQTFKSRSSVSVTDADKQTTITGLKLAPSTRTDTWNADLAPSFSGTTSISYKFTDLAWVVSNAITNAFAGAFTVKDSTGAEVATCVLYDFHGNSVSQSKAYLINNLTGAYTTYRTEWDEAGSKNDGTNVTSATFNYYPTSAGYETLTLGVETNATTGNCLKLSGFGDDMYTGRFGDTYPSTLAEGCDGTSTVFFEYENGVLDVKVSTLKTEERMMLTSSKDGAASGQGQIISLGKVEVDLSAGYTVSVGSAPSAMVGEVEAKHPFTSAVLITDINGVDTTAATTPAVTASESITYTGEKVVEDRNVIELDYYSQLNDFNYQVNRVVYDGEDNTKSLNINLANTFAYSGNKKFIADETITVVNGGASKEYDVKVGAAAATINAEDLIVDVSGGLMEVTAATKSVGRWNTGRITDFYGVQVRTAHTSSGAYAEKALAQFNGLFQGDAKFSFSITENTLGSFAAQFTVVDKEGNDVFTIVPTNGAWNNGNYGAAYVYDYGTQKYTSSIGGEVTQVYTFFENFNAFDTKNGSAFTVDPVLPNYNAVNVQGSYWFDYDETEKAITVKAINTSGNYVTLGVVEADLSAGYYVRMGNASGLTEGNIPKSASNSAAQFTANMANLVITELNGYDLSGETVGTDVFNQDIAYGDNNELTVARGSEVSFDYNTEFVLGSFVQATSENLTADLDTKTTGLQNVTVTAANGYSEEFAVTVKTLADMLTETSATAGAQMRIGDPTGLRFGMTVGGDDMALIEANVGEGKYYTEVSYRMFIVPYAYADTYGDFTAENLFGEQAKYTWKGKTTASADGAVEIMERTTVLGMQLGAAAWENPEDYYLYFAITKLEGAALTAKFMGIGCVELTTEDGDKEYKVVSLYDTYVEDGDNSANNVRSVYDVAVAVYNDSEESLAARQLAYDFIKEVDGDSFTDEKPTV